MPLKVFNCLQDGGVDLIEQPCAIHNTDAMLRLSRRFDVAIMADESLMGPTVRRIVLHVQIQVQMYLAVKVAQSGGLIEA